MNARARNSKVEATLNHPFAAQVDAAPRTTTDRAVGSAEPPPPPATSRTASPFDFMATPDWNTLVCNADNVVCESAVREHPRRDVDAVVVNITE